MPTPLKIALALAAVIAAVLVAAWFAIQGQVGTTWRSPVGLAVPAPAIAPHPEGLPRLQAALAALPHQPGPDREAYEGDLELLGQGTLLDPASPEQLALLAELQVALERTALVIELGSIDVPVQFIEVEPPELGRARLVARALRVRARQDLAEGDALAAADSLGQALELGVLLEHSGWLLGAAVGAVVTRDAADDLATALQAPTLVALRRFEGAQGRIPGLLDELAPAWLGDLPADPTGFGWWWEAPSRTLGCGGPTGAARGLNWTLEPLAAP